MSNGLMSKSLLSKRWLVPWLLAVAVLAGPAYPMYVHYDFAHSRDTLTYLSIAKGEFRGTSVTRRYRMAVPAVAAAVAWPVEQVYARVWPNRPQSDWPLRLAFYLVNTALLGLFGAVLYRTARHYGTSGAAGLAAGGVLTSRWAVYAAGLPLVDSLYCLTFALALYGVAARARWALIACLLLGPLAKESFVFVVPWVLWFGRPTLGWPAQLGLLVVSGGVVLLLHRWIDAQAGAAAADSVQNAFHHFENVAYSLQRLFSPKGIGELFSIFGFFWLIPLVALRRGRKWLRHVGPAAWWLLVPVGIHMLLSGDLGRMGYLAAPTFVVVCALAADVVRGAGPHPRNPGATADPIR